MQRWSRPSEPLRCTRRRGWVALLGPGIKLELRHPSLYGMRETANTLPVRQNYIEPTPRLHKLPILAILAQ